MFSVILLLLLQSPTISGRRAVVIKATARTVFSSKTQPIKSLDGDSSTYYHSKTDSQPEWLKLTTGGWAVQYVVIGNRYFIVSPETILTSRECSPRVDKYFNY